MMLSYKSTAYVGSKRQVSLISGIEIKSKRSCLRSGMKKWGIRKSERERHVLTLLGSLGEGLKLHSDVDSLSIARLGPWLQRNAAYPSLGRNISVRL